jgi:hypothetical protein
VSDQVQVGDIRVDPKRMEFADATGIYVRALGEDGKWDTYDLAQLDHESLRVFASSRGEVSEWAMGIIEVLMGHRR